MGPEIAPDMSSNSNQNISIPKLQADGSNWSTYSERVLNLLTSKGLKRHVLGKARKPVELVEDSGAFYKPGTLAPMTDSEVENHELQQDDYKQKQAAV